jgi:HEAT repeat protein
MRRIYWAAIAFTLLTLLTWVFFRTAHPSEPAHNGRRLSVWLTMYSSPDDFGYTTPQTRTAAQAEAVLAVHQIGTNAIPALLRMARAHDSLSQRNLIYRLRAATMGLVNPRLDYEYQILAKKGFELLGESAKPAVPSLAQLLNSEDGNVRETAASGLNSIGAAADGALQALTNHLSDVEADVPPLAAECLGKMHTHSREVVPTLVGALESRRLDRSKYSWPLYHAAIQAIGNFGADAKVAASTIAFFLDDPNAEIRADATNTLRRIDPEAAARAGIR